jgi:hypothetical protein
VRTRWRRDAYEAMMDRRGRQHMLDPAAGTAFLSGSMHYIFKNPKP